MDTELDEKLIEESVEPSLSGSNLDSKTSQMDDALALKFEHAIHKQTTQYQHYDLIKIAREHDPIDLAHTSTRLPPSARVVVYKSLPDIATKAAFLIHATSHTRFSIFRSLTDLDLKELVESMPPDEAVSVLDDLTGRRRKRVISLLDPGKAQRILVLQQHGTHTAGRLMSNEFFAFDLDTTVGQATARIRDNPGIELTRWIFVVDEENKLVGFVPDRNLIINPDDTLLVRLMRPVLHTADPEAGRDEVIELFERYQLPALPVVDSFDHLLGVITQDDVVEVMEDITDETIASIGGTVEELSEDEPLWKRFFSRAPWLLVTLLAGLTTATGLAFFQHQPWFIIVPFFVPLITGMSGNVGIQCSTVLVRGIAVGDITSVTRRNAILRELRIGMLIGLSFGTLCGFVLYFLHTAGLVIGSVSPFHVAIVVSSGVLGACFTATLLGTLTPFLFAKLRIDPAIASGPIVTAFNDVLSTYMYFLVAWIVARLI